jgi:multiple sugar transport system substrate-binding protein
MRKIVFASLALLLCASLGYSQATTLRWAYWGGESRVKRSQQAIDAFMAANPGVAVNPEPSGGAGDHFTKVDTQLAGGAGPDIIQMGGNINDYVKKGVLLPLDAYAGAVINVKVIDPSAIESGTIGGKLYGVSTGVNMPALVYNKTMIEKAGAPLPKVTMTYEEFKAYLVALKAKLPKGAYPMMDIGVMSSNTTPFGYWTGYNRTPLYVAATNTSAITAAVAQKYLELFADYRKAGLVPPADIAAGFAETNADSSAIVAGKVAIGFLWTNQLAGWQGAMKDELAFIEFPGAAVEKCLWQAPSQFYTVNKDSKNPALAAKFINFLVNDPAAAKALGNDRGFSASSVGRAAIPAEGTDLKVLDYLKVSGPHSRKEGDHVPNDTQFNNEAYLIYQKVAFGQLSPKDGGQQIADLIQKLIKK